MKKRHLYKLDFIANADNNTIEVVRTDNNYGTQGYVRRDGTVIKRYHPRQIPQYIVDECMKMFSEKTS